MSSNYDLLNFPQRAYAKKTALKRAVFVNCHGKSIMLLLHYIIQFYFYERK
jgi:hypothetical protein